MTRPGTDKGERSNLAGRAFQLVVRSGKQILERASRAARACSHSLPVSSHLFTVPAGSTRSRRRDADDNELRAQPDSAEPPDDGRSGQRRLCLCLRLRGGKPDPGRGRHPGQQRCRRRRAVRRADDGRPHDLLVGQGLYRHPADRRRRDQRPAVDRHPRRRHQLDQFGDEELSLRSPRGDTVEFGVRRRRHLRHQPVRLGPHPRRPVPGRPHRHARLCRQRGGDRHGDHGDVAGRHPGPGLQGAGQHAAQRAAQCHRARQQLRAQPDPGQRLDRLRQRLQELGEQHRDRLDLQRIAGAAQGGAVGLQGAVRRRHGFVLAGSRQQPRRDVDGLHQHLGAGPDQQRLSADRQAARLCRIEDGG